MVPSLGVSMALHAAAAAMVVSLAARAGSTAPPATVTENRAEHVATTRVVFLLPSAPGGGGGGGGGNRQSGPIRRAEAPGRDPITLRSVRPIETPSHIVNVEPPLPGVLLDAAPLASGFTDHLGLPSGGVSFGTSTGSGSGGGVGTGTGTGIGAGRGPGLGDGVGGGTGGGVYRPGGSVTAPRILSQVRPSYTPGALERRIQGAVELELVVTAAGMPSSIRVVRSLDEELDEAAIKAVREWRFEPGRMAGAAVDVLVTVILGFSIR